MNWQLKTKIVEKYRTQSNFVTGNRMHQSDISRVVKGHWSFPDEERQWWAELLSTNCAVVIGREVSFDE